MKIILCVYIRISGLTVNSSRDQLVTPHSQLVTENRTK